MRQALTKARYLLLRRPDHLTAEEQARVDAVLAGPLGACLSVARTFLLDWYAIWRDDDGRRRDPDDARERHRRWHEEPPYRAVLPLARAQRQLHPGHFERLSPFLAKPTREATNNGAERTARLFRHRQAPHFALRTRTAIDDAMKAGALLHKEEVVASSVKRAARSRRGRPCRADGELAAA